jgi:hypothetical protein
MFEKTDLKEIKLSEEMNGIQNGYWECISVLMDTLEIF